MSLHELELGRGAVETGPDDHGDGKRRDRNRERQPANHAIASAVGVSDEQHGQRADDGQQPGKRQEHFNSQTTTPKAPAPKAQRSMLKSQLTLGVGSWELGVD